MRCAIGRSGVRLRKREGDGASPVGSFGFRRVLFRPDRIAPPATALPIQPMTANDGWCDDPASSDYNRQIRLPHPASHEELWRSDHLYDVVVILGHNDSPPVPGLGSAIFLHLARPDFSPTEGCLALQLPDLLTVLESATPADGVRFNPIATPESGDHPEGG